jgi:hypothetical protein
VILTNLNRTAQVSIKILFLRDYLLLVRENLFWPESRLSRFISCKLHRSEDVKMLNMNESITAAL